MTSDNKKAALVEAAEEKASEPNHTSVDAFAAWFALGAHAKKRRMRRYPNRGKGGRR